MTSVSLGLAAARRLVANGDATHASIPLTEVIGILERIEELERVLRYINGAVHDDDVDDAEARITTMGLTTSVLT